MAHCNLMMKCLNKFFAVSLILTISGLMQVHSQEGKPFIENFPPSGFASDEYDTGPQILSGIQDNTSIFYFANGSGILEFDGVSWRMIDSTKGISFEQFEKDETGRIYCGGKNAMGYLKSDFSGRKYFQSLPVID